MNVRFLCLVTALLSATSVWSDEPAPKEESAKKTVKLTISPETTYFTGPQFPDGRVDYYTAINRIMSQGITRENNQVAGLFTLTAGEYEIILLRRQEEPYSHTASITRFREKYWKSLGFDAPPPLSSLQHLSPPGGSGADGIDPCQELLKYYPKEKIDARLDAKKKSEMEELQNRFNEGKISKEELEKTRKYFDSSDFADSQFHRMILEELDYKTRGLWTAEDLPLLDHWMQSTTEMTAKILEISRRPDFYNPIAESGENQVLLCEAMLPYIQSARQTARYLSARGKWHFARGEYGEAFECAFATLRIGHAMRRNSAFIVENLVGIAMEGIGTWDVTYYLGHLEGKKDAAWILQKRKEFAEIFTGKPFPAPPKWLAVERCGTLTLIQAYATSRSLFEESLKALHEEDRLVEDQLYAKCLAPDYDYDWDKVLRRVNGFFDDLDNIYLIPLSMRRVHAYERFEQRLRETAERLIQNTNLETGFDRENVAADFFLCVFSPVMSSFMRTEIRAECLIRMADITFALTAYRAEHGDYPDTFDALVPEYCDAVPSSPYTEKPMRYLKREHDVLLVNDEAYKFDGSEPEVEAKIAEKRGPDSFHFNVQSFVVILHSR
ncbi:MAG: hypothetical protein LBQ54_03480 [Planctomycetaceae bacterium]|jgi:hypothetical protein|nr:hypothetical protein [Planctomycetaceae bacterium]